MKKSAVFLIILYFIFCGRSFSQDTHRSYDKSSVTTYRRGTEDIPLRPGMQLKKIGGINAVIPEGTEIYERKGLIFIESTEEYAARRFKEAGERLQKLEDTVKTLSEKVENLKKESPEKPAPEPEPEPPTTNRLTNLPGS